MISDLTPEQMAEAVRRAIEKQTADRTTPPAPKPRPVATLEIRPSYTIADFLAFHDEEFIINACVGILQRQPDERSLAKWLKKLRAGTSRLEILRDLRFSPEGVGRDVRVLGLSTPDGANILKTRRKLIVEQLDAVWARKIRRLRRQIRSLKERVRDLERASGSKPADLVTLLEGMFETWEARRAQATQVAPREAGRALGS